MTITTDAADIFRDMESPGSAVPHEPEKPRIRTLFASVDSAIIAIQSLATGGHVGFATKALMTAELDYPEGTIAEVLADPTPANNGIYIKIGASGTGSWSAKVSDTTYETLRLLIEAFADELAAIQANFDPFVNVERALRLGAGGDSIIQDNLRGDSGGDLCQTNARGEISVALLFNPRFEWTNWADITKNANSTLYFNGADQGVNGDRSDQLLARIDDLTSQALDVCYIAIGVNDILQGVTAATAFANIQAIVRKLTQRGIIVVLGNVRPVGVSSLPNPSGARTEFIALNALIEAFWDTEPGVVGIDLHSIYESGGGIPGGTPNTALYYDAVHPNDLGAFTAAPFVNAVLNTIAKDVPAYPIVPLADNLWPNPHFTVGGGTASTGVTGTVAGSWRVLRVGSSPTVAASLVAQPRPDDADAQLQRLVITPSGAAPTDAVNMRLSADVIDATGLVGEWVYPSVRVRLSDWAYWRNASFQIAKDGSVVVTAGNMPNSLTTSLLPATDLDPEDGLLIQCPPYQVEVGVTQLIPVIDIRTVGNGTGTGTVEIFDVSLIVGPDPRR